MERIKQGIVRSALAAFLPLLIAPDINGQVTPPPQGSETTGVNNQIRISASCASHGMDQQHLDVTVKGPPRINWITHLRSGEEGFWVKLKGSAGNEILAGYSLTPDTLLVKWHGSARSIRGEEAIPLVPGDEYSAKVVQHPYVRGFPDSDKSQEYDRVTFQVPFNCAQ